MMPDLEPSRVPPIAAFVIHAVKGFPLGPTTSVEAAVGPAPDLSGKCTESHGPTRFQWRDKDGIDDI
jgi:hypothetical protein